MSFVQLDFLVKIVRDLKVLLISLAQFLLGFYVFELVCLLACEEVLTHKVVDHRCTPLLTKRAHFKTELR